MFEIIILSFKFYGLYCRGSHGGRPADEEKSLFAIQIREDSAKYPGDNGKNKG